VASGSADASSRLYLEACALPQDQVAFEANDAGRLNPFKNAIEIDVRDGRIVSGTFVQATSSVLTGSGERVTFLTGSEFASTAGSLLDTSVEHFKMLHVLGTQGKLFDDARFLVNTDTIPFKITKKYPIGQNNVRYTHVKYLEGLFNDVRLSKHRNFKFLPPINDPKARVTNGNRERLIKQKKLGNYVPWGVTKRLSATNVLHELNRFRASHRTVRFDPTSKRNNLVLQMFEIRNNSVHKLDVIPFGKYWYRPSRRSRRRIVQFFFIGRIMTDDEGNDTFIHLFTLVFGI
jgi:hypothetical protein